MSENEFEFGDKDFSIEFFTKKLVKEETTDCDNWDHIELIRSSKQIVVNCHEKINGIWYQATITFDDNNVMLTKQLIRLDLIQAEQSKELESNDELPVSLIESKAHREDEVNQYATFPIVYKEDGRCSYCGSLSPTKLVEAIKAGIGVSFADRKYGWPHKLYLDTAYSGSIKFYTVHLRDATDEESEIIAKACGLRFKFDTEKYGDVQWEPYNNVEE